MAWSQANPINASMKKSQEDGENEVSDTTEIVYR